MMNDDRPRLGLREAERIALENIRHAETCHWMLRDDCGALGPCTCGLEDLRAALNDDGWERVTVDSLLPECDCGKNDNQESPIFTLCWADYPGDVLEMVNHLWPGAQVWRRREP